MKTTTIKFGKYVMLSFLALGITVSSCKKEEEEEGISYDHTQKQVPIVYKSTGETCYYCGAWGWQAWIDIAEKYEGKALGWANYSSGFSNSHFRDQEINSSAPTMEAIKSNFSPGGNGKPNFFVNGKNLATSQSAADAAVAASIATSSSDVVASAAFEESTEGNVLTVNAQAKFYKAASGKFYMAAYVIEDKVSGPQSGPIGASGDVNHHLVMRGSMSSSAWGEAIVTSSAAADETFEKEFTVTLPSSYNKANIHVGIVIWKKVGSTYEYVNAATGL